MTEKLVIALAVLHAKKAAQPEHLKKLSLVPLVPRTTLKTYREIDQRAGESFFKLRSWWNW